MAVGGYGRGTLSPHSDIDLLFVWAGKVEPEVSKATLRNLLYPLWDAGFQVGHAVTTAKGAIERCGDDLHAATSLLSARHVSGAPEPFEELIDRRTRWIRKNERALVRRVLDSRTERHLQADRAGWTLAPDLKDDIGGLRDVDLTGWLSALTGQAVSGEELEGPTAILLAAREALHSEVPRKTDRLRIDLQSRVAARLGLIGPDAADELMAKVHTSARVIERVAATSAVELPRTTLGGPRRSGSVVELPGGIRVEDGMLRAGVLKGPDDALRLLSGHAATHKPLDRAGFERLRDIFATPPLERWESSTTDAFFELLQTEAPEGALELLDHCGGWDVLIPEWSEVRGRAQHDPYHRYTVDAHSFVTVGMVTRAIAGDPLASTAADEAGDLRSLYLAALLHDIGKGRDRELHGNEDHSIAGERMARAICERMGLSRTMTNEVAALVMHHLLLSDTATRRDLDDGAVIDSVATTLGDARRARLLFILSQADGRATGREAWTEWKASLVTELYRRVVVALETGERPPRSDAVTRTRELEAFDPLLATSAGHLLDDLPPSYLDATEVEDMADDLRLLMHPPKPGQASCNVVPGWEADHWLVTVCVVDRPGALARTAGVLALHRMSVLTSRAYTTSSGLALERFVVRTTGQADWDRLRSDISAVYSGRLALDARLEKKISEYGAPHITSVEVRVLQEESEHSTVLEIRSPDALGLLYCITSALGELDVDIHVAKIDTLGARVVDVFYVRSLTGEKLTDDQVAEVVRALQHKVAGLLG